MPSEWFNWHAANEIKDKEKRELYFSILAEKKPRFMIYIYPDLNEEYTEYIKKTNKKSIREFSIPMEQLLAKDAEELTDKQKTFVDYYHRYMPVGVGDCVMNKICGRFEKRFDQYLKKQKQNSRYDYTIMKSGAKYSKVDYKTIKRLYDDYNRRLNDYTVFAKRERIDDDEAFFNFYSMQVEFRQACDTAVPDPRALCDILLDICYSRSGSKKFVWAMCGSEIIGNLLEKNGHVIHYPTLDEDGDITFRGKNFTFKEKDGATPNEETDPVLSLE